MARDGHRAGPRCCGSCPGGARSWPTSREPPRHPRRGGLASAAVGARRRPLPSSPARAADSSGTFVLDGRRGRRPSPPICDPRRSPAAGHRAHGGRATRAFSARQLAELLRETASASWPPTARRGPCARQTLHRDGRMELRSALRRRAPASCPGSASSPEVSRWDAGGPGGVFGRATGGRTTIELLMARLVDKSLVMPNPRPMRRSPVSPACCGPVADFCAGPGWRDAGERPASCGRGWCSGS